MSARRCVIVGAGAQGRVVLEAWRSSAPGAEHVFVDDADAMQGKEILGARVAGKIADLPALGGEVVLALGNNELRLRLARELAGKVEWGRVVHSAAWVSPSATLGEGTVVFAGAMINTEASLGAHAVVNTRVVVEHDAEISDGANFAPGVCSGGRVKIGEGAFVSTGVTLAARAEVGAWSVVGAGAVVVGKIPERSLAYGVPARVVRSLASGIDWKALL